MVENCLCWKFEKQRKENTRSDNKLGPSDSGKMENNTVVNLSINIAGQKKTKAALHAT